MPAIPPRERLGEFYGPVLDRLRRRVPGFDPLGVELLLNLIRSGDMLRGALERQCRGAGLTGPAFGVLTHLEAAAEGRLSMGEIGERMLVTQANVTGLVDTLERRGLVRRTRDPEDRRVTRIEITPAGRRALDSARPERLRFTRGLLKDFRPREKRAFISLLERLRAALVRASPTACLLAFLAIAGGTWAQARPITLEEAYSLALVRSEELSRRREAVAELDAKVEELRGAVKPRLSLKGSDKYQDYPGPAGDGFSNTFTQRNQPEAKFSLHQSVFSGFREFLAFKAARAGGKAASWEAQRAQGRLYADLSQAYLDLLGLQKEVLIRRAVAELTRDRVTELAARRRLGRSRPSEVLAAESQLAQVEAQIARARGAERASQEALRFLTGLAEDLEPNEEPVPRAEPLEPFLGRAARRPEVEARRLDVESADGEATIARRGGWPTVGVDGNYYLKRPAGFSEHIRWDVMVSGELPLYLGGTVRAQTRQAGARLRSARASGEEAGRRAEADVRAAHRGLESALEAVRALEVAERLAEANAKAQSEDYRLGMVTNLDVLGSLAALQELRLQLDQGRREAVLARVKLEVAAGGPSPP